ncbi:MAG: phytanoyl-CoA dioxygenase family protein [Pseudomonadota bacterium]
MTGAFNLEPDAARAEFDALTARHFEASQAPLAEEITQNVPAYNAAKCRSALSQAAGRAALLKEWAYVLGQGPGVLVVRGAVADEATLDSATAAFEAIIRAEAEKGAGQGDHFAAAGANDRVWNALQKLCAADPALFARYFGNPVIAAVCEAWLGPHYQMTAQVNVVRPGGAAQDAHRDYHLGFQPVAEAARFPEAVHLLSQYLTLQGAIAHCDMPVESGPTKILPFSQLFGPGYLLAGEPVYRERFEALCIQLPLAKGDAIFFSPALFHAAGENRSNSIRRMANLLQVSSAFGRAMESVDRSTMCRELYPALLALRVAGALDEAACDAAIAAAAEGYAFPTNLDTDPPLGGRAPESQAALMRRALSTEMPQDEFNAALAAREVVRAP